MTDAEGCSWWAKLCRRIVSYMDARRGLCRKRTVGRCRGALGAHTGADHRSEVEYRGSDDYMGSAAVRNLIHDFRDKHCA
jgi:hypothetical protein